MSLSSSARGKRWRLAALLLPLAFLPFLADACLRVPTTPSVPPGLYLLTHRAPVRGGWVVVCLPEDVARRGRRRGYLGAGRCPGGASEVLKRVAALPGDEVIVSPLGLVVDGQPLPRTARRARDSAGRPLPAIPAGVYPVAPGTAWLYSDHHPRSWDSRYYGPVPLAGVRSTARLLLAAPQCASRPGGAG